MVAKREKAKATNGKVRRTAQEQRERLRAFVEFGKLADKMFSDTMRKTGFDSEIEHSEAETAKDMLYFENILDGKDPDPKALEKAMALM